MKKVLYITLSIFVSLILSFKVYAYDQVKVMKERDKKVLLSLIDKVRPGENYKQISKKFDVTINIMGVNRVTLASVYADAYARRVLRLINVYNDMLLGDQQFDVDSLANHVLIDRLVELQRVVINKRPVIHLSKEVCDEILDKKDLSMADQIYPDLIYKE